MGKTMKIGILGSGAVGQSLGRGFLARGDEVMLASRAGGDEKIAGWVAESRGRGRGGTFAEAAGFGELVVLATSWGGTENALRLAGAERLAGKVVIDVTNPLEMGPGGLRLAVAGNDSGGEQVQRWLPSARVVKAFNIVGADEMVRPDFPCGPPTMFYAADDSAAGAAAAEVCRDFGWEVVHAGGLEAARMLEPLALLWITQAMRTGNRSHAFKLLRR